MSDHNFEKQVQQKLDELKIRPSDNVWTAVQVSIPMAIDSLVDFQLNIFSAPGFELLLPVLYLLHSYQLVNSRLQQEAIEVKGEVSTRDGGAYLYEKQKPSNSNIDDDISLKTPRASRDLRVRKK